MILPFEAHTANKRRRGHYDNCFRLGCMRVNSEHERQNNDARANGKHVHQMGTRAVMFCHSPHSQL